MKTSCVRQNLACSFFFPQEFKHDGIKGVDRIWNLNAVPKLTDFVYVIQDEQKHSLSMTMTVIENFKSNVLPLLENLESGPIHGDFNEQNILGLIITNEF